MTNACHRIFPGTLYGLLLSIALVSGAHADRSEFTRVTEMLTFSVTSSKAKYDFSEPIVLGFTLTNRSRRSDMTVATSEAGTVSVASITRNGYPVKPILALVR